MSVYGSVIPGARRLASIPVGLSKQAKQRLKWFDYYRYFGISPQTFYRWKRRYDPLNLKTLENHSYRPKHLPQPTAPLELVLAVQRLREQYPRWGKDKLVVLLYREGYHCFTSMVGRMLRRLKDRSVLREPIRNHLSAHRRGFKRPYALRKPKDYQVAEPGDLSQLDIRPLPGVILNSPAYHLPMGCNRGS